MPIQYKKGDATDLSKVPGPKILMHIVNSEGKWGAGFVLALSKRWKEPEIRYRSVSIDELFLGSIQAVAVEKNLIVVNMVAQELGWSMGSDGKMKPPIRYESLNECLDRVDSLAWHFGASVHAPRIGAGLAGGDWDKIEKIIMEQLSYHDVTIYDL
jgi:O-acetyl-ADP-ribose deacetylase (regulator of RNase III)